MKKTKLNAALHQLQGKMVEFAGWELPIQFSGINQEHLAVRTAGGLFDVSHMGEIIVSGPQALAALQYVTANDLSRLEPGKIHYNAFLTPEGTFVDDLLVYMMDKNHYLLVVNAGNTGKDFNWLQEKCASFEVELKNLSELYSQIAVQGPQALPLLAELTDLDLAAMPYYGFAETRVLGLQALVSRTGYTGEDGFEVYMTVAADEACKLMLELASRGESRGVVPVGLGARDTLRLEAKMALYGNDIDDSHTVLEADLGWILKLDKGDFIGREALARQKEAGISRKLVGFKLLEPGIARHGYPIIVDGRPFGAVTSGTMAPFLKQSIGLAYLPMAATALGTEFQVEVRGRALRAEVVKTPFYKRSK